MRHLATFVSVVALVWAVSATLRVPGLTWTVPLNVMAQCFFALLALWGLQKTAIQSPSYWLFFNLGFLLVLLTALICSGRFLAALPLEIAIVVMVSCIAFSLAVARVAVWRMEALNHGRIPAKEFPLIWQGAILLLCGSVTLISLLAETRPALQISATALGCFWFLLGCFFFAYAVGNIHLHTQFQMLNRYLPAMLAIVAFSWLAFQLSGLQAETARQEVPQNVEVISQ